VDRVSEYKGRTDVRSVKPGELKPGDRVVNAGAANVSDGQTVSVNSK
jgi:hypothetical protein